MRSTWYVCVCVCVDKRQTRCDVPAQSVHGGNCRSGRSGCQSSEHPASSYEIIAYAVSAAATSFAMSECALTPALFAARTKERENNAYCKSRKAKMHITGVGTL